jgi:hypothetical protein
MGMGLDESRSTRSHSAKTRIFTLFLLMNEKTIKSLVCTSNIRNGTVFIRIHDWTRRRDDEDEESRSRW